MGLGTYYRFLIKTKAQKSHATVPLNGLFWTAWIGLDLNKPRLVLKFLCCSVMFLNLQLNLQTLAKSFFFIN